MTQSRLATRSSRPKASPRCARKVGQVLAQPTSTTQYARLFALDDINGRSDHAHCKCSVKTAPVSNMECCRLNQLHGVNAEKGNSMRIILSPNLRNPRFSSAAHWLAPLIADRGDGGLDVQIRERRSSRILTGINMMSAFPP